MTYQPLTNPIECPECRGLGLTVTQRPYMTGSFPPCALCSGLGKVSGPVPARPPVGPPMPARKEYERVDGPACATCLGSGATPCPICEGKARGCTHCNGIGSLGCTSCNGLGTRSDLAGLAAYDQAARTEPQGGKAAKGLARVEAELEVAEGAIESARHALWDRAVSGNEFAEIMPVLNLLQETLKVARLNLEITKGRKGGKL